MEQQKTKQIDKIAYITLGGMAVLGVVGLVLLLARGLDASRFLISVSLPTACLPFVFSFDVFLLVEAIHESVDDKETRSLFGLAPNRDKRITRISLLVAGIGLIGALITYFICESNEDLHCICLSLMTMASFPAMAVYFIMYMVKADKENAPSKIVWGMFAFLMVAAIIELVGIMAMLMLKEAAKTSETPITYEASATVFVGFPLIIAGMLGLGRD